MNKHLWNTFSTYLSCTKKIFSIFLKCFFQHLTESSFSRINPIVQKMLAYQSTLNKCIRPVTTTQDVCEPWLYILGAKFFASHQSLVTRYQSLVTSHQSLVTSYQSLVTSYQSLVTSHQSQLLITSRQLLNTSHQMLLTCSQLILVISSQLLTSIIYELNFSFKMHFLRVSRRKNPKISCLWSLSFACCR